MAVELYNSTLFNDANLQAYYRLEGNANDSKNSNNLTSTNSPGTIAGMFGNALDYESSTPSYSIGSLTAPTGNFTIMAWVKFESLQIQGGIACFGDAGGSNYTGLGLSAGSADKIRFTTNGGAGVILDSDVTVTTGTWYFAACVFDGTNKKVMVNGTIKSIADAVAPSTTSSFGIAALGAYVGSAIGDGVIDDVAYFNRALSDTELLARYNGTDTRSLGSGSFLMNFA